MVMVIRSGGGAALKPMRRGFVGSATTLFVSDMTKPLDDRGKPPDANTRFSDRTLDLRYVLNPKRRAHWFRRQAKCSRGVRRSLVGSQSAARATGSEAVEG